ncbi:MAG: endolytic transglycosylase MltG [Eubacteriales bacterium]
MKNDDSINKNSLFQNNNSDNNRIKSQGQRYDGEDYSNEIEISNSQDFEIDRIRNEYSEEQPTYKGEVYFSNPPKADTPRPIKNKKTSLKMKRRKAKLTATALLSIIVVFSMLLSSIAISCVGDILAIHRSEEIITVNIPEGADTNQIIKILNKSGLIKQRIFCDIFTGLVSKIKKSKTPKYLNGVYYVKSNLGLEAMLNEFKSAQVTAETVKLVFPEGWTIYQMIDKIAEYKVCNADYLYTALNDTKFNYTFVSQIKTNENRAQKLEGYFFPDTYEFFTNENANSVIRRFLTNFNEKWVVSYSHRAKKIGMSMDEILIIASIIQKKAANSDQMPLISSVLHNRLNKSSMFPALECNSTKDYVTKYVKPLIGGEELTKYLLSYNTYTTQGLPPGPICNPGINAIEAALYPKETNYYYFQHDDSGEIYLAKTLAEQNANTMLVLRANNK